MANNKDEFDFDEGFDAGVSTDTGWSENSAPDAGLSGQKEPRKKKSDLVFYLIVAAIVCAGGYFFVFKSGGTDTKQAGTEIPAPVVMPETSGDTISVLPAEPETTPPVSVLSPEPSENASAVPDFAGTQGDGDVAAPGVEIVPLEGLSAEENPQSDTGSVTSGLMPRPALRSARPMQGDSISGADEPGAMIAAPSEPELPASDIEENSVIGDQSASDITVLSPTTQSLPVNAPPETGADLETKTEEPSAAPVLTTPEEPAPVSALQSERENIPDTGTQETETQKAAQDLEKRMAALEKSIEDISARLPEKSELKSLHQTIATLELAVKALSEKPAAKPQVSAPQKTEKPKTSAAKPVAAKEAAWQLRSAKTGEAWLALPGSNDLRVAHEGDDFPGLGKIISIRKTREGLWVVEGSRKTVVQ